MQLPSLLCCLFVTLQVVFATPPPEHSRVLVVLDDTNPDFDASALAGPLEERGFDVRVASIKEHPRLMQHGLRTVDNVLIIPGKTKALGSTLKSSDLMQFMKLGGNVLALTTPKYSPVSLRDVASQVGITISGRGIESKNSFSHNAVFPHPPIISADENSSSSSLFSGSAVATLNSANELTLGLVQAPYSSYSYNAAKDGEDETLRPISDAFAVGSDAYVSAGLQSLHGSRFVWVGAPELLLNPSYAYLLTSWAFQERGKLRIAETSHASQLSGESHLHYKVEEPLKYCAQIEQWVPELNGWIPYENIEDVQLEFKMLDPYYRLNLDRDGCVEFIAPDQYGMFTFQIDYKRPGQTFLDNKEVVTVRHRANDEWDRSWTITNSWVYLSGVSTTVIGFVVFLVIYLASPEPETSKVNTTTTEPPKEKKLTKVPELKKEKKITNEEPKRKITKRKQ